MDGEGMSERDELANAIADNCVVIHDLNYGDMSATTLTPDELADVLLSAGFRKPRTIATAEEVTA